MFTQIRKLFTAGREDVSEANAKIAALEKEVAELKAILGAQTAQTEVSAKENAKASTVTSVVPTVRENTSSMWVNDTPFGRGKNVLSANMEFHNRVLMGRWRGKAGYIQENGRIMEGELVLEINQCCVYLPPDRLNPYERIHITHGIKDAIRLDNDVLVIYARDGVKKFAIHEGKRESLCQWMEKILPELEKVRHFPKMFLSSSDKLPVFGHPFFENRHGNGGQLMNYLTEKFPVFVRPIPWYDGDVFFSTSDNKIQFRVNHCVDAKEWTWTETPDQIQIDLCIFEAGFFDDSESEFRFVYTFSWLGEMLKEDERTLISNSKLQDILPLEKWSQTGYDSYILEKPFGMDGYYKVTWRAEKL